MRYTGYSGSEDVSLSEDAYLGMLYSMQYDICHPYILTKMKSRVIFQNGFQTDEEAIISNLKEQFLEMFTETYL